MLQSTTRWIPFTSSLPASSLAHSISGGPDGGLGAGPHMPGVLESDIGPLRALLWCPLLGIGLLLVDVGAGGEGPVPLPRNDDGADFVVDSGKLNPSGSLKGPWMR